MEQILSLLANGESERARKIALRLLYFSPYKQKIIEIFSRDVPTPKTCKCGRDLEQTFIDYRLVYRTAEQCGECAEKERQEQKLEEEKSDKDSFDRFLNNKSEEVVKIMKASAVPEIFINALLDDFKFKFEPGSYFIMGTVGTGKSHLAAAMLRDFIESLPVTKIYGEYQFSPGVLPIFTIVPERLLEIRSSFCEHSTEDERAVISRYSETPFLVLDDLGVEKASEWAMQTLYLIINRRCTATNLITVITSNLSLNEIGEKLEDRIASRIKGMCKTIELKGVDRRL
jgi:DNA replication protein DnaC